MKINNIIIVGYGNIAKRHENLLNKILPNAKIKFFRRKKNVKIKKSYKFLFTINDVKNFLPDLIVIANPSSHHITVGNRFIQFKVPFFIEKPISNNFNDAKKFLDICSKKGIKVFVGYNLIFSKSLQILKKLITQKKLGKINLINVETGYNIKLWRKNINYKNTASSQKKLGGGVLLELSHEINYLQWLFGNIKKIDAFYTKLSSLNIDVEDYANLRIFFEKKKYSKKLFANVGLDFFRKEKKRTLLIIGEKTTLRWDGVLGKVDIYDVKQLKWKNIYTNVKDLDNSYIHQWYYFFNLLKNNSKITSSNDALKTLLIIKKIRKKDFL